LREIIHTQSELIRGKGAKRTNKGQEALRPPVLKARRHRKRQHLHRCLSVASITMNRVLMNDWFTLMDKSEGLTRECMSIWV